MIPETLLSVTTGWWVIAFLVLTISIGAGVFRYRVRQKQIQGLPALTTIAPPRPIVSVQVAMISYTDLASEHDRLTSRLTETEHRIAARLEELRSRVWESKSVTEVLLATSPQERQGLAAILKLQSDAPVKLIVESIGRAGSNATAIQARKLRGLYPYVMYREVLTDVAKKLGAPKLGDSSTDAQIEQNVVIAMLDKATPEQRMALIAELSAQQAKLAQGLGVATSGVILANLSGFGLYVAASSALGALTSAIGVTLPFAVYTGMSSTLAVLMGPVAWTFLLAGGVVLIGGVDFKKTLPGVLWVTMVRARLIAERDQEIVDVNFEASSKLAQLSAKIAKIQALLDLMKSEGLSSIPIAQVPR